MFKVSLKTTLNGFDSRWDFIEEMMNEFKATVIETVQNEIQKEKYWEKNEKKGQWAVGQLEAALYTLIKVPGIK